MHVLRNAADVKYFHLLNIEHHASHMRTVREPMRTNSRLPNHSHLKTCINRLLLSEKGIFKKESIKCISAAEFSVMFKALLSHSPETETETYIFLMEHAAANDKC